jgi:hypothetical protein
MPSSPRPSNLDELLSRPVVLVLLWAGAVTAVALAAGHFWIPLDDGTLAQSAERVLHGQLPQRDFGDPYSGLNAILGAVALHFFGDRLSSLRVPLVVGFALWLPGLWLVARRFLSEAAAAAATLLAAILSVPTYPAAMPTWFTLYLITWGLWCLMGFLQPDSREEPSKVGSRWWLAGAGFLAGLSILFKVVGLYFVAAALLAIAARRGDGSRSYAVVASAGVAAFLALLGRLVLPEATATGIWHFFVPAAGVSGAVVWTTWHTAVNGGATVSETRQDRDGGDKPATRAKEAAGVFLLVGDGLALIAGVVLPVAIFLIPYLASGSVDEWLRGVFVLPTRRLQSAASPLGSWWTAVPGAVAVGLLWIDARLRGAPARRTALGLAALLAVALGLDDALGGGVMESLWYALRGWVPMLAIWGAVAWARGSRPSSGETAVSPGTFALVAAAALWVLVEFPYASPAYFFYVAPVGVLATAALVGGPNRRPGPVLALLAATAAFLGAGYGMGVMAAGDTPLDLPRGGIRVSSTDARTYERVVALVRDHIDGGGLWAGPDSPEVYYLTGEPNPTPTLYEFLDTTPRGIRDLDTLFASHDVRVTVVNRRPLFSAPLDSAAVAWLYRMFPAGDTVGSFSVRWKETP